jgi:hypothetical protein
MALVPLIRELKVVMRLDKPQFPVGGIEPGFKLTRHRHPSENTLVPVWGETETGEHHVTHSNIRKTYNEATLSECSPCG